jgi:hypothetical protein
MRADASGRGVVMGFEAPAVLEVLRSEWSGGEEDRLTTATISLTGATHLVTKESPMLTR